MTSDINGPWDWLRNKTSVEDFMRLSAQVAEDVIRNRNEVRASERADHAELREKYDLLLKSNLGQQTLLLVERAEAAEARVKGLNDRVSMLLEDERRCQNGHNLLAAEVRRLQAKLDTQLDSDSLVQAKLPASEPSERAANAELRGNFKRAEDERIEWVKRAEAAEREAQELREELARHKKVDDRAFELAGEVPDLQNKLAPQAQEIKTLREKLNMKTNVDHLHCTTLTCVADELARINSCGGKGSGFWKPRAIKAEALVVDLQKSQAEIINSLNNANASLAAKDRLLAERAAAIKAADDIVTCYGVYTCAKARELWEPHWVKFKAALPAPQASQEKKP